VFALGVNISNYLVLGKTSPLTYQVLGHLKTVLILILGFTVFDVWFVCYL
jgi:solute carrier family 35 protein E3